MRKFIHLPLGAVAAAALIAGAVSAPVQAADFSGKRVEFFIPYGTGGGSDTWARFLAPRLTAALPGNPVVAVKNVPGGGSITGTNQFAERAKADGLTVLGTSGSTQFPYLLGDKRVKYDYKNWIVVMVTPTGGVVYTSPKFGIKSAGDLKKLRGKKLVYGSQGATALDLVPKLAFEILGLDVKAVFGMKGRGPARLAFERGETNIDYQTSSAYLKNVMPLVKGGKAVPLFSWGIVDDHGNFQRDPTFPDLPHVGEVYEKVYGKKPKGPAWTAFKSFVISGFAAQKMIFLPKGTPKDAVDAWRNAVKKVVSAPDFKKASTKALGDYEQAVGKKADTLYKLAITVDPKSRKWVRDWLTKKYKVKF